MAQAEIFPAVQVIFSLSDAKIVVIGWVNGDSTLRAYESKNDAYRVFARMLDNGNPPSNWDELLSASHECDFEL